MQEEELACNQMEHSNQLISGICARSECNKPSALCQKCILTFHQSCQVEIIFLDDLHKDMEIIENECVMIDQIFVSLFAQLSKAQKQYQLRLKTIQEYQSVPNMTNLNNLGQLLRGKNIEMNKLIQGQEQITQLIDKYFNLQCVEQTKKQNVNKDQHQEIKSIDQSIKKEIWLNIGNDLFNQKQYLEAIQYYDIALGLDQNFEDALINKGEALDYLHQFEKAILCYDLALIIDAQNETLFYNKGLALYSLNNFYEAIKCFDNALKINPKYEDVLINKGNTLQNLNKFKEAIECYDAALMISPNFDIPLCNKGLALCKLGDIKEGIKHYDTVLRFNESNGDAWFKLGNALQSQNKFAEAINSYNESIIFNPTPLAYYNKAISLQSLNKIQEAEQSLTIALELDPNLNNGQLPLKSIQPSRYKLNVYK